MNSKNLLEETYDVAVVGAGHAGCEAALACARLGLETIIFTVSVDSIALMPCNPNIGGSSKGHLVREIDALGGQMGINIDKTFIQSKMLNKSKGPAVHSLRAQADKANYSMEMRNTLQNTEHLTIRQAEVAEILTKEGDREQITGVKTVSGATYHCKAVVLCTGTYLRARCLTGEMITYTGPNGLMAANHLTDSLLAHGVEMFRFKTGTPARIDKRSIDFSKMEEQKGDEKVVPFSFTTNPKDVQIDQVSCWLTYTNEKTHEIIRNNLDRSPIYAGIIEGTGPRYCPSIEDKVVKFADKDRHQIFIEPEGLHTNEMYVGGMSSSLPEDVQHEMYRTLPGLEHVKIVRNAYAIEYDCINPNQLYASLEFKKIRGLFSPVSDSFQIIQCLCRNQLSKCFCIFAQCTVRYVVRPKGFRTADARLTRLYPRPRLRNLLLCDREKRLHGNHPACRGTRILIFHIIFHQNSRRKRHIFPL